jgi:hypothetical protein
MAAPGSSIKEWAVKGKLVIAVGFVHPAVSEKFANNFFHELIFMTQRKAAFIITT